MPYTVLAFIPRAPSLSHAAFKEYYETNHVPLVTSLIEAPYQPLSYKRRYVRQPEYAKTEATAAPDLDFDVITELTFADEDGFQKCMANLRRNEETWRAVREDEDRFLVREKMRVVVVEEEEGN